MLQKYFQNGYKVKDICRVMLQAQVNSKLAFINSMIFRRDNMKTNKGRIEQSWRINNHDNIKYHTLYTILSYKI